MTAALETALRTRFPDIEVVPAMSSGGTDGMHFRRADLRRSDSFFGGLDHWMIMIKELAGPDAAAQGEAGR